MFNQWVNYITQLNEQQVYPRWILSMLRPRKKYKSINLTSNGIMNNGYL